MKILITGSKGQLGKELNKQLMNKKDVELILTDQHSLDITDLNAVNKIMLENKPGIVINCAAHTAVDLCETDRENAFRINAIGPENLARATNRLDIPIIHISTDYVFDGEKKDKYIEIDNTNPQTVYGQTKLEGEKRIRQNNPKYYIIRTAWLYGDGNNFVKTMIDLTKDKDEIKVVNDQFGTPTSTAELSKAIITLMYSNEFGLYHGTCEGKCSWYEFSNEIFRLRGLDVKTIPITSEEFSRPAKRPRYSVLENLNLKQKFNYFFSDWEKALFNFFK
ncbi:MAG: dTDP-4-dehydrorhamnose reductase [Clostridia bacterium]